MAVVVSVRDNGMGIDPSYHEQVFGLFKRLHAGEEYAGTGIGLAICQKLVERYGGGIWVDSADGRGSRFFSPFRHEARYKAWARRSVAVLAGAFNPPTRAHVASAGRAHVVDEVLLAIPRSFPAQAVRGRDARSAAYDVGSASPTETPASRRALPTAAFLPRLRVKPGRIIPTPRFTCCADETRRIVSSPGTMVTRLSPRRCYSEFELLVAPRAGVYVPPENFGTPSEVSIPAITTTVLPRGP